MADLHVRRRVVAPYRYSFVKIGDHIEATVPPGTSEDSMIPFRNAFPRHGPTVGIGADAHGLAPDAIREQCRNFVANGGGVMKWNQNAASLRQQFARVPIGGRDNRFPKTKAVG